MVAFLFGPAPASSPDANTWAGFMKALTPNANRIINNKIQPMHLLVIVSKIPVVRLLSL